MTHNKEDTVTLSIAFLSNYADPIFYCRDNDIPYIADPVDLESSSYEYETVYTYGGPSRQMVTNVIRPLYITVPASAASLLILAYEGVHVIELGKYRAMFEDTITNHRDIY